MAPQDNSDSWCGYYIRKHDNFDREIAELLYPNDEILQLPSFDLVGFATYHQNKQSILVVALVYPTTVDVDIAADTLAERLDSFVSIRQQRRFWIGAISKVLGIQGVEHNVALVSLTVDDPTTFEFEDMLIPSLGILFQFSETFFLTTQPYD